MSVITWRGVRVHEQTRDQLLEVERLTGIRVRPTQGSYSTAVGASAGTHSEGGAVDLSVDGLTKGQITALVFACRRVGLSGTWFRPYRRGVWAAHIHCVSTDGPDLAPSAARQIDERRKGGDGLVGDQPDPHANMQIPIRTWAQYRALPAMPAYPAEGWTAFRAGRRGDHVKLVQRALGRLTTGTMTTADLAAVKTYRSTRPWLWPPRAAVGPATYAALRKTWPAMRAYRGR